MLSYGNDVLVCVLSCGNDVLLGCLKLGEGGFSLNSADGCGPAGPEGTVNTFLSQAARLPRVTPVLGSRTPTHFF